jgi:hypothetical protein
VFGVLAHSTYNDSLVQCPKDKNLCTPRGVSQRNDAITQGNVATAAFIVGGAAHAAGVVLWLPIFGGGGSQTKMSAEVAPTLGGLTMRSRW